MTLNIVEGGLGGPAAPGEAGWWGYVFVPGVEGGAGGTAEGGGLYNYQGAVTLNGVKFLTNAAAGEDGPPGANAAQYVAHTAGGASRGAQSLPKGHTNRAGTRLEHNIVGGGVGGGVGGRGYDSAGQRGGRGGDGIGAAIFANGVLSLNITKSTFVTNLAFGGEGGKAGEYASPAGQGGRPGRRRRSCPAYITKN